MTPYKFGDAWERYPMERGQIWKAGEHLAMVGDLEMGDLDRLMAVSPAVDAVYTDPPWTQSLASGFRTMAESFKHVELPALLEAIVNVITNTPAKVFFIEMGTQNQPLLEALMERAGTTHAAQWRFPYGKSWANLGLWTRGDFRAPNPPPGIKGYHVPDWAISEIARQMPGARVLDPMAGIGLTIQACMKSGLPSTNMELAPRRCANVLKEAAKRGLPVERLS